MHPVRLPAACRLAICLLYLAALPGPAGAADFVVNRYDDPTPDGCDPGDCSLREAVIDANFTAAADRILLSAGIYRLTIVGTNENLAADGDLDVESDLEILGVGASMTRIDSAGTGEATLTAIGSELDFTARKLTVRSSDGDGLLANGASLIIEDCEFRDNGDRGIQAGTGSELLIRRSTITGNGLIGLSITQGSAIVENCTVSGNGAQEVVVNLATSFSCTHCTIADATDIEPELHVLSSTAEIANSIVAGNCTFSGGAIDSLGGNVESTGHTCQFDHATDVDDASSFGLLEPLTDNGGGTRTHLPGFLSAANGAANGALCLPADQRGAARTTNCESGAVEQTFAAVPSPIFVDGFEQGNTGAWKKSP